MIDCSEKGRITHRPPPGEAHGCAILTEQNVRELRGLREADPKTYTLKHLASMYGVSVTAIHKIVTHERWRHI